MRFALLIGVTLVSAFAGCLDDAEGESVDVDPAAAAATVAAPANITHSEMVPAGLDPFNTVDGAICTQEVSTCIRFPFTANRTVEVVASLTWMLPSNDFDLYIVNAAGEQVLMSANGAANPTGPLTSEGFEGSLKKGDYEVVVVAWAVLGDTYDLAVSFA